MNSKRLLKIANCFDNEIVIDIGSDHGHLPIYLLQKKIVTNAYVIEVNDGPMQNATRNVKAKGLEKNVQVVKSDGLQALNIEFSEDYGVVIAGMGGSLIKKIIENDLQKFKKMKLYLQPNNKEDVLRKYLVENGFMIIDDLLVKEDVIIYSVIIAKPTNKKVMYKNTDLLFGFNFIKDNLFLEKWQDEHLHLLKITEALKKNGHKNLEIEKKLKMIKDIIGE